MSHGPQDDKKISKIKTRARHLVKEKQPNDAYSYFKHYQEIKAAEELDNIRAFRARINANKKNEEMLIPRPPIKQLVYKGGGAKGGGHPGAFDALEEQGFADEVETVFGASAGAITAFIIGLGFSAEQISAINKRTNFLDFTDIKPDGWAAFFNGNHAGNILDFMQYGAVFTGDAFHDWASMMVEQILGSPNATFADLHNARMLDPTLKNMVFKATRYNAQAGERIEQTFSYIDTPNIRIADALRASMAFPGAFAPMTVRDKQGKIFGVFADGGILNNYPIDEACRQEYQDRRYKPLERLDNEGKAQQVNPCAVGFNLVNNLDHLDDNITPLSPRLRRLIESKNNAKSKSKKSAQTSDVEEINGEWRFNDILNAILWHKIGRPVREKVRQKEAIFNDQTVQIWVENVGTLEFDASQSKLDNLYDSGKNAMLLWLKRNRNPAEPYPYPDNFDDRPTNAEKLLKQHNPASYFQQRLTDYYIELLNEMKKAQMQGKHNDKDIVKNVKIHYLCRKIETLVQDVLKRPNLNVEQIEKAAFHDANTTIKAKEEQFKQQRAKRDIFVNDQLLLQHVAEKLIKHPKEGCRLLRGQISRVIPLIRLHHGGNLLSIAVQTGDVSVAQEVFSIVNEALKQCYYQGRKEDIKYSMPQMLNDFARPPLFHVLAGSHDVEMINLLLKQGVDPLAISPQSQTNGLQEMIHANDYESFKAIIHYCKSRRIDVKNIRLANGMSIAHFILQYADKGFIAKLTKDKQLAQALLNYHIKDGNYNDILHQAAIFSISPIDVRWKLVESYSPKKGLEYDKIKQQGMSNVNSHKAKREFANSAFQTIIESDSGEILIDNIKPQVCLQMLNSFAGLKHELRFCTLAQDPGFADIFIALCERINKDSSTKKQLQHMLSKKINGKTALYLAAQSGNTKLVRYLRHTYDCDVNNAGPIDEPCALNIAAKNGHNETVSALMKSITYGLRIGYCALSRRSQEYHSQKTPLHHLAINGSPQAFCDVLFGGGLRSKPEEVALMKDKDGKTPFSYLIEFDRLDILEEIWKRGKGARKGFIWNDDYLFAAIFGWHSKDKHYEELVKAKLINPKAYDFICQHLTSSQAKATHIKRQVDRGVEKSLENRRSRIMDSAKEMTDMEMSIMGDSLGGETLYDDWVSLAAKDKRPVCMVKQQVSQYESALHAREDSAKSLFQKAEKEAKGPKK